MKGLILLVEDNEINRLVAAKMLEREGYEIVVATNGKQALELIDLYRPDLVLMDIQMPVMDGLTAAAAVRSSEPRDGPRLPIIAVTANVMHGDREMCLEAGMDGYIAKPIDKERLIGEVERFLRASAA